MHIEFVVIVDNSMSRDQDVLQILYFRMLCYHVANSAFHPSGVGKWVPASAGKAKASM